MRNNTGWLMYTREVEQDQEVMHGKRPVCPTCKDRPPLKHHFDKAEFKDIFVCGAEHTWGVRRKAYRKGNVR